MALSGAGVFARGAADSRNWRDGSSREWGATWAAQETADPTLPDAQWCLDLRLGGTYVRVATGQVRMPVTTDTSTGLTMTFGVGIAEELEIEDAYTPGESAGSRSIGLVIPNRLVTAQSLVARGMVLAGDAEISLAVDGMPYEDRYVVIDGDVNGGVSFGTVDGSKVRLSVADPRETAGLPLSPYLIESSRFTAATTSALGQRYPVIFSQAAKVAAQLVSYGSGAAKALVCVPANGLAVTGVYVGGTSYASGHAEYGWSSAILVDDLGAPYLAAQFSGTHVWTGDESVTVDVTGGAETYLHQCIRSLLEGYTALGRRRIHYGLLGEVPARVGSVDTRLYVNGSGIATSTTAMDAIEQTLLDSFPMISMVTTNGRYGPVVTDARTGTRADLIRGIHLLNRESDVEESDKRALFNHFTLFYKYNFETNSYDAVATRSPDNSVLCSRSEQIVGARYADPVESTEIHSDDVAGYVLDWRVFHESMPSYYVEYAIPLAYLLRLRLGWNVRLTDLDLGWTQITATVMRRVLRRRVGTIGLRIYWPNLAGLGSGGGAAGSAGGGGGGQ